MIAPEEMEIVISAGNRAAAPGTLASRAKPDRQTAIPGFSRPSWASAAAPGKVILFGEHAINRGQPAIAASVGLCSRCSVSIPASGSPPFPARSTQGLTFHSGTREQTARRSEVLALGLQVDAWRAAGNLEAIRQLKAGDFFAPQKYMLACALGDGLPENLDLEWESEIPSSSGLGSGGAAFTAMVAALAALHAPSASLAERADWAHRGDIVAHGGIASALDTQTSLLGGVICFTGHGLAQPAACAPGLPLVIAHTGVIAATSEVNTRVRLWLAEEPKARLNYFQAIGDLTRAALPLLERGDWPELGRLMTLNQLVLEKIGVSCPEITRLIEAALTAGALGAKLSGSGGGGIIIALTPPDKREVVAAALAAAGGRVFTPVIAVPGVTLLPS